LIRTWRQLAGLSTDESDVLESTARTEVVNIVAVHPDCRGGNVGADLMLDYETQARRRGTRRLHLLVEHGNLRAERLYASLGWRRTCPDPGRFPVFAMVKDLDLPGGNADS
jgi:GNAT superfamily N-acetyltransferase